MLMLRPSCVATTSRPVCLCLLRVASSSNVHEKPEPWKLQHVEERIIDSCPLFFKQRIDYSIFRKDVVIEDQIFGLTKEGLPDLMKHFNSIAMFANAALAHVAFEPVQCHPNLDDSTIRLRWRVKYVSYPRMLADYRLFQRDYRGKNMTWYDGYSVFRVDGNGEVYRLTVQKTQQDESGKILTAAESLKKKLAIFMPPAQRTAVHFVPRTVSKKGRK